MDKYYTAFIFANESVTRKPNARHVTHKYLGELTANQLKEVKGICDNYFEFDCDGFPKAVFDREEWFTAKGAPVRVLTDRQYIPQGLRYWFQDLRKTLDRYRADEFGYTPHVTTKTETRIDENFHAYVLVNSSKDEIVGIWWN